MNIYLDTIGCRLNQAEIEQYARQFRSAGHTLVASPEQADIVVINTCAVTAAAASDSRQKIRWAERAGAGQVVVTGCWSTLFPLDAAALPGVSHVIANQSKDHLVADLLHVPEDSFEREPIEREPIPGARLRTRAFIKVQDGCDNHCTFCITRLARGHGRSRSIAEILADIRLSLYNTEDPTETAKEIVLTGVHLGSWGQDFSSPLHLQNLIKSILQETGVPRLRLSSLEPWDLEDDFFRLWEDPRLCRHLHLPLQSGCAATLHRMARKVTPESYAALIETARAAIPGLAITTDIITGFPGETEAEFAESLAFTRQMNFAGGHVFTYSARPGTPAARLPDQAPHAVRKERNALVQEALAESALLYQKEFLGRTLPVLWESAAALDAQGWVLSGLTDNYLRVNARAPRHLWNQITPVLLTGLSDNVLQGQLQQCPPGKSSALSFSLLAAIAGLFTLSACRAFPSISQSPSMVTPVCIIQGTQRSSTYSGETVKTRGVVTFDLDETWQKGFYLQMPDCDKNSATSDGIYVYLGVKQNVVSQGDQVEVIGVVDEYFGFTEIQAAPGNVTILSQNNLLPAAADLNPPSENEAARTYLETLEGMLVKVDNAVAVGPTDGNGRTWLVREELGIQRVYQGRPNR